MERRKCFGTHEYSERSWICSKGCPDYVECGEERKRILEERKRERERMLNAKKQDHNI